MNNKQLLGWYDDDDDGVLVYQLLALIFYVELTEMCVPIPNHTNKSRELMFFDMKAPFPIYECIFMVHMSMCNSTRKIIEMRMPENESWISNHMPN